MKRFMRLICLLLVIATMVGVLAACGDKTPETTTPAATTTTTKKPTSGGDDPQGGGDTVDDSDPRAKYWVYDEDGFVVDPIDYEAIDYSNEDGYRKFDILVCEAWSQWTFPKDEGTASNPMQGAAYLRNIEIEDLLGVDFELTIANGHSAYKAEWMTAATTALDNGSDLFCGYSRWMAIHAMDEYLENLYQYKYPDLTMPWYPLQLYQGEYSQYNCLFYVTGACTTRTTAEGNTVFANLTMINDAGLADPVQTAIAGKWTIDELYKYTYAFRSLAIETKDSAEPKYGIVLENIYPFYFGMGNRYCQLNPNTGKQELVCSSAAQLKNASDCVEEVMKIFDAPECNTGSGLAGYQMMNAQMGAFVVCGMLWIRSTNGETGYAALPIPKRNLEQSSYLTQTTWAFEVFGIPTSTENGEMSAVVLEAVYSSDYRTMAPLFFEKNLKGCYTNTSDGSAVYDLIRFSRVIDFGVIHEFTGTGPYNAWNACFSGNTKTNSYVLSMTDDINKDNKLGKELKNVLAVYRKHGLTDDEMAARG